LQIGNFPSGILPQEFTSSDGTTFVAKAADIVREGVLPVYHFNILDNGKSIAQGRIAWPYMVTDPELWIEDLKLMGVETTTP